MNDNLEKSNKKAKKTKNKRKSSKKSTKKDTKEGKLKPRELLFCVEYCKDLNAYQAALRAGYSEETARSDSYKYPEKPGISEKIQEILNSVLEAEKMTVKEWWSEVSRVARANMDDFAVWGVNGSTLINSNKLERRQKSVIAQVESTKQTIVKESSRETKTGSNTTTTTTTTETAKIKLHPKVSALELIGKALKIIDSDKAADRKAQKEIESFENKLAKLDELIEEAEETERMQQNNEQ